MSEKNKLGAGRKPLAEADKKKRVSVFVSPATIEKKGGIDKLKEIIVKAIAK